MAKQLLAFVALLVFQGITSSVAAPKSSTAFDEWLSTFDPSTAIASKIISCVGKPNGFYPDADPDTCSAAYTACVSGNAYPQTCPSGTAFDSTIGDCVDRYAAASAACSIYPAPACSAANVGEFQPTEKCSDLYYICLSATGQPNFQVCPVDQYFNPVKKICEPKAGADACIVPPPPPTVPTYGCSDKATNTAYAIATCSVSYYTCTSTTAQPTPGSCNAIGAAGTVFDYRAAVAAPGPTSCVSRTNVPECASSLLASV